MNPSPDGDSGPYFVYHELWTSAPQERVDFYQKIFGWTVAKTPQDDGEIWHIESRGVDIARIVPTEGDEDEPDRWNCFIATDKLTPLQSRTEAAKGEVLSAGQDLDGLGRASLFADSSGGLFAAVELSDDGKHRAYERDRVIAKVGGQSRLEEKPSSNILADGPTAPGFFCWHDLLTCDLEASSQFYQSVLGVVSRPFNPDTASVFRMLSIGGRKVAGLMVSRDTEHPSLWLPYVAVADVRSTLTTCVDLGGQAWLEPTDVEELGTFAVVADPGRALIALREIPA